MNLKDLSLRTKMKIIEKFMENKKFSPTDWAWTFVDESGPFVFKGAKERFLKLKEEVDNLITILEKTLTQESYWDDEDTLITALTDGEEEYVLEQFYV